CKVFFVKIKFIDKSDLWFYSELFGPYPAQPFFGSECVIHCGNWGFYVINLFDAFHFEIVCKMFYLGVAFESLRQHERLRQWVVVFIQGAEVLEGTVLLLKTVFIFFSEL